MSPGQTGFVPGTKWVCPRDKPRFSPYFTQRKPSSSLGQTQFVPGTFRGRRAAERVYVCDLTDHLQESPGPPGPESQKSLEKSLFGGLQKSPRKYPKKSENTRKYTNLDFFGYFSTFSGIFGNFSADPQKDSFRDFFGISGPEGPETPVNGRSGRKSSCVKSLCASFVP